MPIYVEKIKDKDTGKMIDKLVNGKKQYYIRTYINDEFGNRKQVTRHNKEWIGREGQKEAYRKEIILQNKIFPSVSNNFSLEEGINKYLQKKRENIEITTYKLYIQIIDLYIYKFFSKKKKIKTLTINDVNEFKKYLNNLNLSFSYKKTIFNITSGIFEYLTNIIGIENLFKKVGNFVKNKKQIKKETNFLTEKEFDDFIKFETSDIHKYFFIILFYTGARKGELLALKKEDISFENNYIWIKKTYNTNYNIETLPKSLKSNRKIAMTNIVSDILKDITTSLKSDDYLFKEKIKATTLREKCNKNCKKANITKRIRIHDFRHSFASMCIHKNVPIQILSEYLGHENIYITLKTYAHLYPNEQEKLINILNSN